MFLGKSFFSNVYKMVIWTLIVNRDIFGVNRSDRDFGSARNTSPRGVPIKDFQRSGKHTRIDRKETANETWFWWTIVFLEWDKKSKLRTKIHAAGGHFLLNGTNSGVKASHNNMEFKCGKSLDCLTIASKPELSKIYVCLASIVETMMRRKTIKSNKELQKCNTQTFRLLLCLSDMAICSILAPCSWITAI